MLQLIYETFRVAGDWPTFQYVSAQVWQELEVEPREVYYDLSATSFVRPAIQRGRAFELRDDTKIGISLRGLNYLREAADDISHFVSVVRYIGERAARFRPSTATEVEHLQVTSEEIRLALGFQPVDAALLRQAVLFRDQAGALWVGFSGPDASGGWSIGINPERARRYRNIHTLVDFFAVEAAVHSEHTHVFERLTGVADVVGDDVTTQPLPEPGDQLPTAFVSYSHRDQSFVDKVVAALKQTGVRVWIDRVDLLIGDSLVRRIGDAIRDGDFVVAVISKHSVKSPWCDKELALAVTHGIRSKRVRVLPIRLGDVQVPSFLEDTVWGDADVNDPAKAATELATAIGGHLDRL